MGRQVQEKTRFTIGADVGTTAGLSLYGMSVETSRAFKVQWERELTVTVSENLKMWTTKEYSYELKFENGPEGVTYIEWQIYDIWEIVYDSKNGDSWAVGTELRRPEYFPGDVKAVESPSDNT